MPKLFLFSSRWFVHIWKCCHGEWVAVKEPRNLRILFHLNGRETKCGEWVVAQIITNNLFGLATPVWTRMLTVVHSKIYGGYRKQLAVEWVCLVWSQCSFKVWAPKFPFFQACLFKFVMYTRLEHRVCRNFHRRSPATLSSTSISYP